MPICPIIDFNSITETYKSDVVLIGPVDGHNMTFYVPELYIENSLTVYFNGQGMHEGNDNDYVKRESAGVGTGFDEVVFNHPPHVGDVLTVSYFKMV